MTGPLAGTRVVELAGIGPAPFAAMLFADLGADVVRVERPGAEPLIGTAETDLLNRGKRSVAADLKSSAGLATVRALVERAEILVEGFRPGVTERLGLGPEECLRRNPALVYGRMTGWGQVGPLAPTAGHDVDYLAITGVLHAIGRRDGPPQIPLNLLGDFGGGALYLVVGLLSAVLHARATGEGQVVDAAIVDGAAHLATMHTGLLASGAWRDERGTNLVDTGDASYDVYETADGEYVAVGALEPQFYAELVEVLGIEPVAERHSAEGEKLLRERLEQAFRARTRDEWAASFAGTDSCVAPVLGFREAFDHPHLRARGTYVEHGGVVQPAPAPRFSATPAVLRGGPPVPGQDTAEVLRDWDINREIG
jgi:alpha-methylacyl-CoA racemase